VTPRRLGIGRRRHHLDPGLSAPVEVDPPERDAPDESNHERGHRARRAGQLAELGSDHEDRLTERDGDEEIAALRHVLAGDRVVGRQRAAETREREPRPGDGVEDRKRDDPERDASLAFDEPARDQQRADRYPPDEHSLENGSQPMLPTNGGNGEELTPEEARRESRSEREPVIVECSEQRRGHDQTRKHQPDEHEPRCAVAQIEVVRDPGNVVPRTPDGEEYDQRLDHAPQRQIGEQVARELRYGEDVDEIEEQLDRPDCARSPAVLAEMSQAPVPRCARVGCRGAPLCHQPRRRAVRPGT
jgi:hypothetical protein